MFLSILKHNLSTECSAFLLTVLKQNTEALLCCAESDLTDTKPYTCAVMQ
jgi:hypothetical protein